MLGWLWVVWLAVCQPCTGHPAAWRDVLQHNVDGTHEASGFGRRRDYKIPGSSFLELLDPDHQEKPTIDKEPIDLMELFGKNFGDGDASDTRKALLVLKQKMGEPLDPSHDAPTFKTRPEDGGTDFYCQSLPPVNMTAPPYEEIWGHSEVDHGETIKEQEITSHPNLLGIHRVPGGAEPGQNTNGGIDGPPKAPTTPTPTPTPPDVARRQHSCVLAEGDRMIMFGGMDERNRLRNDVWSYSFRSDEWSLVTVRQGPQPSRRLRHTAVMRYIQMVIFGGNNGLRYLNDVWLFDLDEMSWSKLHWNGWGPRERERTSAVFANDRMYVFGGYGGWHFNDVWMFDFHQRTWTYKYKHYGQRPSPRASHAAVFEEFMYIFGGVDWWNVYNDLWRFDIQTNMWQQIAPNSVLPPPRFMMAATSRGRIYVFGGTNGRREMSDMWVWDLASNEWEQINWDTTYTNIPKLREHTVVIQGNLVVVHGGWGGVSTSARTYGIDILNHQLKTLGWAGKAMRITKKDSLAHGVATYNMG